MSTLHQQTLPDSIDELKSIIFSYEAKIQDYESKIHHQHVTYETKIQDYESTIQHQRITYETKIRDYESRIEYLLEQMRLLRQFRFSAKSEKLTDEEIGQGRLFNEAEEGVREGEEKTKETIQIAAHTRKKGGRKALPEHLPTEEIIHDLSESEKVHSCGQRMVKIGEEVTKRLKVIPQQMIVEVHKRYKYACPCQGIETEGKEGAIRIAPLPPQLIPQSISTSSLLAYLFTSKFLDALPFYRQEKIFARYGIELPRQTMCHWTIFVAEKVHVLKDMMEEDLLGYDIIKMDETWALVLNSPEGQRGKKSYMWVARGGPPGKVVVLFNYHPNRSGEFVRKYLAGWKGYLQCDGYSGYDSGTRLAGITLVGCWAHARRKFKEAYDASRNGLSAGEALKRIRELYAVESEARDKKLSPAEVKALREEKSAPLLKDFKTWLDRRSVQVPPKSLLGKAICYTLGEWEKLTEYLKDGRLTIDNNMTENSIRPFVMGRKNWLFSSVVEGAEASSFMYSLILTAEVNGLDPYWYLYYLFEKFPLCKGAEDYRALLPYNISVETLAAYCIQKKT